MGIESYTIMILFQGVEIYNNNNYWNIVGKSNYITREIVREIEKMSIENLYKNEFLFENIIEIKIYEEEEYIQGIEMRGCLSCMESGIKSCYKFINELKSLGTEYSIWILNKKTKIENEKQLYNEINSSYYLKIESFKKQYENINLKTNCSEFYNKIYKRNKWYMKIYRNFIKIFKNL